MSGRSEEHTSELQSPVHLVDLPSFPTRRSSDLSYKLTKPRFGSNPSSIAFAYAAAIASSVSVVHTDQIWLRKSYLGPTVSGALIQFSSSTQNDTRSHVWEIGRAHV